MKLTSISHVSKSKAKKLHNEYGISFAEDLATSNAARIDAIDGLSPKIIANACEHIDYTSQKVDKERVSYICEECGKNFGRNCSSLRFHVRDNAQCGDNLDDDDDDDGWSLFSKIKS